MAKENTNQIHLKVKDHSVSGEVFELIQNSEFGFLETSPLPASDKLSDYYKSEDYISHTDSKRNLFEKAYHVVRRISLKKKLKLINSFSLENKILLDVGCGTGDFLQTAQNNNWQVSGIEPNSFGVITLWHVLEHLSNLENQITILKKLLKPNGTLIIAVPNYKSFDAKHYAEFWAAFDVPRHLWHFNKESVSKLVAKFQMEVM